MASRFVHLHEQQKVATCQDWSVQRHSQTCQSKWWTGTCIACMCIGTTGHGLLALMCFGIVPMSQCAEYGAPDHASRAALSTARCSTCHRRQRPAGADVAQSRDALLADKRRQVRRHQRLADGRAQRRQLRDRAGPVHAAGRRRFWLTAGLPCRVRMIGPRKHTCRPCRNVCLGGASGRGC